MHASADMHTGHSQSTSMHACEALPRQGQMLLPLHHCSNNQPATRLPWPSRKASLSLAAKYINGSYSLMLAAQLPCYPKLSFLKLNYRSIQLE